MTRSKNHVFDLRLRMAKHARVHGVKPTARLFRCSRNTVRKWLARLEAEGPAGLTDRSRAPKSCPHKTAPAQENKILAARAALPCAGPRRLKDLFGLKPSQGAIARVIRQASLAGRRKKKRQKKNDLRAIKAKYKPFERLQDDAKPLRDIPHFWPQMMDRGLPRHQYTIRDVKSGALFVDYADELSATYSTMAAQRLLGHLKAHGVDLGAMKLSTDNGSEYGGGEKHERKIGFHAKIEACGVTHVFLPPRTPNAHADVESSHAMIELELFDLEDFKDRPDFFDKARTYQRWWNFARPNYSKGGKTPAQILEEAGMDPRVLLLDPLDLDAHLRKLDFSPRARPQGGHHLPALPDFYPLPQPRIPAAGSRQANPPCTRRPSKPSRLASSARAEPGSFL
jgi:hypothetical protein